MDITDKPDEYINQDVTMNDVANETALKICTTKYNKTSGIKYISDIRENTENISAEVLILIPNNDVSSNRKKRGSKNSKGKLLRCLLDTGTSKNTIKKYIAPKNKIKARKQPLLWDTFGGTIKTKDYVNGLDFYMPEFSDSQMALLDLDIIPEKFSENLPYDIVIGREGLKKLKT